MGDLLYAFIALKLGDIKPWVDVEPTTLLTDFSDLQGLTVNELFDAVRPPERDAIMLGAVLNGFVAREDVAWDGLNLDAPELAGIDPTGGTVTYGCAYSSTASASADVLTMELPDGWRLAPGGVVDDGTVVPESQLSTSGQTTQIEVGGNGYGSILRVTVFAGLDIGQKTATFTLSSTVEPQPAACLHHGDERNRSIVRTQRHTGSGGDSRGRHGNQSRDAVRQHHRHTGRRRPVADHRAAGYELSVALSGMTSDFDVIVYSPPGATEDPLVGLDGGLRQAPDRSLPFLPDFGLASVANDTRVQPERLQDIPLQPGRRVYAASLDRGRRPSASTPLPWAAACT